MLTRAGGALVAAGLLAWLAMRPTRVQVLGDSMSPALEAGDRAIALRPWWVRPGAIVVLVDPRLPARTLVKRALWLGSGGGGGGRRVVWVEGDNPGVSTDSRSFGLIPRRDLRGVLVWLYSPAARAGRVSGAPG
ncbi:MAG: S26 family signal peptidase [Acidimicrobiales bacterium]